MSYDATNHANLEVNTTYGVAETGSVKEAIEKDGTLHLQVNLSFLVHHAAREPVTPETLAGLITKQGICPTNVDECFIFETNND